MNAVYALVLFLVVITSTNSVSCTFSKNDDKEIAVATKDHQTPTTTEDDNQFQIGRFKYRDGNISTLLRPVNEKTGLCVEFGGKCAWYKWCCGELHCVNGHCAHHSDCLPLHSHCDKSTRSCCYPYHCFPVSGQCTD